MATDWAEIEPLASNRARIPLPAQASIRAFRQGGEGLWPGFASERSSGPADGPKGLGFRRGLAQGLLKQAFMNLDKPIAVRHLEAGGRRIAVHFFRNAGGSVCGHLLFGAKDTPIVDGPTTDAVLSVVSDALDGLLFARAMRRG